MNHTSRLKNFFQSASCVTVALGRDNLKYLKILSERYAIELLFKVQVSPDHPTSSQNQSGTVTSMLIL